MTSKERLVRLVQQAAQRLGSNVAVARYVGKSPQLITEYVKGRTTPPGDVVIRLQDLLKKAACVLVAALGYTATDPAQAAFDRTQNCATSQGTFCAMSLKGIHIVQHTAQQNSPHQEHPRNPSTTILRAAYSGSREPTSPLQARPRAQLFGAPLVDPNRLPPCRESSREGQELA